MNPQYIMKNVDMIARWGTRIEALLRRLGVDDSKWLFGNTVSWEEVNHDIE